MTDLNRIKQLSGMHPNRALLEQLNAEKASVVLAYDQLIREAEKGQQIDEGLFTSLKATLATVGHLGASGAKKIAAAAKNVAANIKELYLDQKAKAELQLLVKNIKVAITNFEAMEKDASTIIQRDQDVQKEMALFKTLFTKLLETLETRLSLAGKVEEE